MTMPMSKTVSGMFNAVVIAANAAGNPAKSNTTTRTSQTWFASQTGVIALEINSLCSCLRGPLDSRSHTPPP